MAEESAKLRIPYIAASQAQKHVTHNEGMTLLDTLVQLAVLDKDLTAPPGSPAEGDTYIVAGIATGDWEGWDNRIARFIDGEWRSYLPGAGSGAGWRAWVIDENAFYVFDGASWNIFSGGGGGGGVPPTVQIFTASGTYTKPTSPAPSILKVTVKGAGGGGGGAPATGAGESAAGAGGGEGGICIEWLDATGITSETVTVGSGGAGGAAGQNSGNGGGISSFGALLSATGGAGGGSMPASSSISYSLPGVGGVGSGGDLNGLSGAAAGQRGFRFGGVCSPGPGAGPGGGGVSANTDGGIATGLGAGGGGGGNNASQGTARAGGDGSDGVVIVEEFY